MKCCDVQPMIVGITGGIGSGKSVVSRILRLKGFCVYDCDTEARRLMEYDHKVKEGIVRILGAEAYAETAGEEKRGLIGGGQAGKACLNRSYVASKIFNDSRLRDEVNSVVHRAVAEDFLSYAKENGGMVFCETAILATSHMDSLCGSIWVVTTPEDERIGRVERRSGLSEEAIRLRMVTQREEFERLPKNKVTEIRNGNSDMLLPQIDKLVSNCQEIIGFELSSFNGEV
ncbi:MAG: dephospho-CoA kinase [Muribaculaceae bacterium]|nr:dephospho-CoA kinase [Muribaculaceae bacterium]